MMKIAWLSGNMLGYELLKETILYHKIELIIIPCGIMYDAIPLKRWRDFSNYGISIIEKVDVNELDYSDIDLLVMCGCRQIISKNTLKQVKVIGFHPTLLPHGRGLAPIINTILQGETKSGITMYQVDEGIDTGDIISQSSFRVSQNDYALDVYHKVIKAGKEVIENLESTVRVKQGKGDYYPRVTHKDNEIKPSDNAVIAYRKIRAFSKPYDGAYINYKGGKLIIWRAELLS